MALPTYNEADNIVGILTAITAAFEKRRDIRANVLVIDGNSPDGTGDLVSSFEQGCVNIELLQGEKGGLGGDYAKGFDHLLAKDEDIFAIMEMDADFSHDPTMLPIMIDTLAKTEADLVIGSRYVEGGFIPGDWPLLRVLNSFVARWVARNVGGLSSNVQDPTAGLRAYRRSTLEAIEYNLPGSTGYVFQVSLTNSVEEKDMKIVEIPIRFSDRKAGESKIRASDITGFITFCLRLNPGKLVKRYATPMIIALAAGSFSFAVIWAIATQLQPAVPITIFLALSVAVAASDLTIQITRWASRLFASSTNTLQTIAAFRAIVIPVAIYASIQSNQSWQFVAIAGVVSVAVFVVLLQRTSKLTKASL